MFHIQVHGAGYTDVELWGDLQEGVLPLLSKPSDDNLAMYMNRAQEIAWMILRLLPTLQLKPNHLNEDWQNKWHVLDDSFRYSIESLAHLGKKIGNAIIELVDSKFQFHPNTAFYQE